MNSKARERRRDVAGKLAGSTSFARSPPSAPLQSLLELGLSHAFSHSISACFHWLLMRATCQAPLQRDNLYRTPVRGNPYCGLPSTERCAGAPRMNFRHWRRVCTACPSRPSPSPCPGRVANKRRRGWPLYIYVGASPEPTGVGLVCHCRRDLSTLTLTTLLIIVVQ